MVNNHRESFTAVVLAGDRGPDDPLLKATGEAGKALIRIGGKIMLGRVLEALLEAESIDRIVLCGPPQTILKNSSELRQYLKNPAIDWLENASSPSRSAARALETIPPEKKVLLTTADHALLTPEIIDYFCRATEGEQSDLAVGMEDYDLLREKYPESRRTVTRFQDGEYCSCNLFAFLTPAARRAAEFWQQVEKERKKPHKLISMCGFLTAIKFLLRQLTLDEGLQRLARKMELTAAAVRLPFAEAAIDVDKPEDLELVREIVGSATKPADPDDTL